MRLLGPRARFWHDKIPNIYIADIYMCGCTDLFMRMLISLVCYVFFVCAFIVLYMIHVRS